MDKHSKNLNTIREEIRFAKGMFELSEARARLSAFVILHPEMSDAKHEVVILDALIKNETDRGK